MAIYDVDLAGLSGEPLDLHQFEGRAVLIVHVASQCGLTPQYTGLECNQFGTQQPGSPEEIATFCSSTYGDSFPLTEKVEVNGANRHQLYRRLLDTPDQAGQAGDIQWNSEKFLVSPGGDIVRRFRPMIDPESSEAIEAVVPR